MYMHAICSDIIVNNMGIHDDHATKVERQC